MKLSLYVRIGSSSWTLVSGQVKLESHGEAFDTPAAVVDVVEDSFCGGVYKQGITSTT